MSGPARRIYRLLLLLLPARFRRDFGPDLEAVHAARLADAAGASGRAWVWLVAVFDVLATAVSERARRVRDLSPAGAAGAALLDLPHDVRFALRALARRPGFTATAVTTLALGIGATVALFSVVHAVLLRPLPYPDAERIVTVETHWTDSGRSSREVSGPDFLDWQADNDVFEAMAHYAGEVDVAVVVGDRPAFANDMYVSPDFFTVLGQTPAAGRLITQQDVPTGESMPSVVVARHGWAVTHFGSAEDAIGETITVYDMPMRIVGVTAPGFAYPGATDLWAPWRTSRTNRAAADFQVVAKLRADVDLERARTQMRAIGDELARQHAENRAKSVALVPLRDRVTGDVSLMLWVLMGTAVVVLLIACANTASLLLARASERAREVALRAALGAGRTRLVRQLLTEGGVLAGAALAGGLLLSLLLLRSLVALSPADLPRLEEVRMDWIVFAFALGVSCVTTLLFAVVPALHAARLDLGDALTQGGARGTTSNRSARVRATLVVAEIALSVVLLATAGLLLRSLHLLQRVDLGFTTERVAVVYTQYPVSDAADRLARTQFYTEVIERLRAVPGVGSAAGVAFLPMGRELRPARPYHVEGDPEPRPGEEPRADFQAVTPGYFEALDIPLTAGRDFDDRHTAREPMVAIVNEAFARAAFPDGSPLGERLRLGPAGRPSVEIIGVAADTRWHDPSNPSPPTIYAPAAQLGGSLTLLARSSLDDASLATTLRAVLQDTNPTIPARFETMDELFADALARPRFRTRLVGAFAATAVLLAAVGLFGVLAYLVGQRTREIAVRRAVGAGTGDVVRLVVGQAARLIGVGLALGLVGAVASTRLLGALLFEVDPWDPGAYLGSLGVLGSVALLAALIPVARATAIAPVIALRQE